MADEFLNNELLDKYFPTTMKIGEWNVGLKGYKEIAGHDDSRPYQAKVYVDGKSTAIVYNDGWGGESNVCPSNPKAFKVIDNIDEYIRTHKDEFLMAGSEIFNMKLYHRRLNSICDELADNCDLRKAAAKHAKKKLILYVPSDKSLKMVPFTGMGKQTIRELLKTEVFRKVWEKTVEKYTSQGLIVLNK